MWWSEKEDRNASAPGTISQKEEENNKSIKKKKIIHTGREVPNHLAAVLALRSDNIYPAGKCLCLGISLYRPFFSLSLRQDTHNMYSIPKPEETQSQMELLVNGTSFFKQLTLYRQQWKVMKKPSHDIVDKGPN